MHCSPTLSADEFKGIHNGLCYIRNATGTLEAVINPELMAQLRNGIKLIEEGLKNAYRLDNEAYNRLSNHHQAVSEQHKFTTLWSVYEVANLYENHPFEQTHLIYRSHWGKCGPVIVPIVGDQWVDLWRVAEQAIKKSGDDHHVFIEAFHPDKHNPLLLELATGS